MQCNRSDKINNKKFTLFTSSANGITLYLQVNFAMLIRLMLSWIMAKARGVHSGTLLYLRTLPHHACQPLHHLQTIHLINRP